VRKLLPGHSAEWRDGALHEAPYWRQHYEETARGGLASLGSEFRSLLRDAVARNVGAGKTGAFLSGGTDSSTVAGYLSEVTGRAAPTYSIGFDAAGYDESDYAELSARHFGTAHHSHRMQADDLLAALPLIARACDEPFGNASIVAAYQCARLAADDGVHTLLAGDGGDELFAGNARYATQRIFESYQRLPSLLRTALIEPFARSALAPRKLASYVAQACVPLPDRLESYNFLLRESTAVIFTPGFLASVDTGAPLAGLREVYQAADAASTLNRMLWLDLKITLADNDIRKVNGACALAGVAVRYPLLDEALLDFSARLPPALKLRGGQLRWFFKDALKDFLPPATLAKKKHGFGLPFGLWLREHAGLRALANDALDSLAQRGIVRAEYLAQLRTLHAGEHAGYYGVMIWVLMMLELWLSTQMPSASR
jgi:asparagine synthase (glutamine-hydrolysing)